jgi:osmotically-inducible protein OsmY
MSGEKMSINANRAVRALTCLSLAAVIAGLLQGCPLLVVGAAGGAALIATDRRTLGSQTEDKEIQAKTAAQLATDMPDTAHVDTTVFNRLTLLTGEVPDEASKRKAEAIARQVNNVRGVVNELAVQGASSFVSRSGDSYTTSKVKASLLHEKDLSSNNFKVVTTRGIVYLMGLVTPQEGSHAADVASRVSGVTQVVKVYQYIKPGEPLLPPEVSPGTGGAARAGSDGENASEAATVGAVPDNSVSARPIETQSPAPIKNSAPIQPGTAPNRK